MTSKVEDTKPDLSSIPDEEKTPTQHAETVEHTEKNLGLRIDGDDLDHEHEPKVFPVTAIQRTILLTSILDDVPPLHEFVSHGFSVDWESDTSLSLW